MKLPDHIDVVVTIGDSTETIRYVREPGKRISVQINTPGRYRAEPPQAIPSTIRPRPKRRGLLGWFDRIEGIG